MRRISSRLRARSATSTTVSTSGFAAAHSIATWTSRANRTSGSNRVDARPSACTRLALITHGALALTAEDDTEAAAHSARTQSHPAAERFPFELARIRLAHGITTRAALRDALTRVSQPTPAP